MKKGMMRKNRDDKKKRIRARAIMRERMDGMMARITRGRDIEEKGTLEKNGTGIALKNMASCEKEREGKILVEKKNDEEKKYPNEKIPATHNLACRLTLQFVGYSGAGFFPFRRRLFLSFPSFFFTLVCSYFVLIFFLSSLHFSLQSIISWSLTLLTYSHPFLLFLSPSQTHLLSMPFLYGILFLLTLSPLPLPLCLSPSLYMSLLACLPIPPSPIRPGHVSPTPSSLHSSCRLRVAWELKLQLCGAPSGVPRSREAVTGCAAGRVLLLVLSLLPTLL